MIDESILRAFAAELVSYACGRWTGGRSEDDAVYREVTEDRDRGPAQRAYSSCGDLAHWLLYRLGCRSRYVNRKEHQGWVPGVNVSRLAYCAVADAATDDDRYFAGDVLIGWSRPDTTDAHVAIALEHREIEPGRWLLVSGEYGQPGGAIREHLLRAPRALGVRRVERVVRLDVALRAAEQQRLLTEPDYTLLPRARAYALEHAPFLSRPSAPEA